jgi:2-polyprenyl-3-methyl-5-hydroxy-6-metoxy-1,4-benzoquinol methylase
MDGEAFMAKVGYVKSEELKGNSYLKKEVSSYSPFGPIQQGYLDFLQKKFKKDARILDIGCGSGIMVKKMIELGYKNVEFCDVDDYAAEIKDKAVRRRIKLVNLNEYKTNENSLPYASSSFDLVYCMCVLEHVENPYNIVREAKRVLKKNGILVVGIPSATQVFERVLFFFTGNTMRYSMNDNHITFYSNNTFMKMFVHNGFKLVKKDFDYGTMPFLHFHLPRWEIVANHKACYFRKVQ